MQYYSIEPEVAGGFGNDTLLDTSVHPPIVTKLHYEFSGWLGDSIVESFPSFIVTEELANAFKESHITGVDFDSVTVTKSPDFFDSHLGRPFPSWLWLKVNGDSTDDVYLNSSHVLVVSERVLSMLTEVGISHADVEKI